MNPRPPALQVDGLPIDSECGAYYAYGTYVGICFGGIYSLYETSAKYLLKILFFITTLNVGS